MVENYIDVLDPNRLRDLHTRLTRWFGEYARSLPWRDTRDPYAIWLSEVILQQTQVVQGIAYYHRFLEAYPTIEALANASEDEVLRLWQGLGYYSRARNLLKTAQIVTQEFSGVFPDQLEDIKRLPGVGPYTQAAILSFAYDKPYAAVDGNVYRVLSRLYAEDTFIDSPEGQRHFRALAQSLLNVDAPGVHNQSMIELGALVCTPRNPDCQHCPISTHCLAHLEGNPTLYPKKKGKIKTKNRYFNFFLIRLPEEKLLIERRAGGDIWQGLYQFPLIETEQNIFLPELIVSDNYLSLMGDLELPTIVDTPIAIREHRLTHQLLHTKLYEIRANAYHGTRYLTITQSELDTYGLPALLVKMLNGLTLN